MFYWFLVILSFNLLAGDVFQTDAIYRKSLAKMVGKSRRSLSRSDFLKMQWPEKIAALNYYCSFKNSAPCRKIAFWALQDRSLLVRDHAFSLMENKPQHFQGKEVYSVAVEMRDDRKNYRQGEPLWIVQRAKDYLKKSEAEELLE